MKKAELQRLSNYCIKRFFGGIPRITTKYGGTSADSMGNFFIEDSDYEIDDPVYKELLYEAPEYRNRDIVEGDFVIKGRSTPVYTDPAYHPKLSICISEEIKRQDLVVFGTLLHELTHYYCWYAGFDYHDGDRQFEKKLKELGFPSNFDRRFNKETKEWNDSFDYTTLQIYLDDFRKQSQS